MTILSDSAPVVHTGVDWISISCNRPAGCAALLSWRDEVFRELADGGFREANFTNHQHIGRQRGSVSVAVGPRSVLCQLSGVEANRRWRDVAKFATNVSRVDLAVTARPDDRTDSLARESYKPAQTRERGRGRPSTLTLIQSQDRGDTLYVGSRKSDQLGRLYNKEKESGDAAWAGCWRWEVQYRRAAAVAAVKAVAGSQAEGAKLASVVKAWFDARGVAARFDAEPAADLIRPPARRSDDDVWLAWVRRCVQPRARELAVRYGWRYVAEQCVGHITTYEEWETLVRGVEYELS